MLSALETKMSEEVRLSSGVTNTPEPEELKEMGRVPQKEEMVPLSPDLECVKPIRNPNRANPTFHRYSPELWSIRAMKLGVCPVCKLPVRPRQEITLTKKSASWMHFSHCIEPSAPIEKVETNFHYELIY